MIPATHGRLACSTAFVLRCSGAATLSYLLAVAIGLPFPMWASMSSLIVSQANLQETKNALLWRLCGTMTGIVLAVIVASLLAAFPQENPARIAAAVALSAALAQRWPGLRVAMWTVPIVYLSHTPHIALAETGWWRGAEVIFGGVIGALFHWLAEIVIDRLNTMRTGPTSVSTMFASRFARQRLSNTIADKSQVERCRRIGL